MSKQYGQVTAAYFLVATAPLSPNSHINMSPRGGESFRVLGPAEVAYQDFTVSGAETAAHLRENGRIFVMFWAFDAFPKSSAYLEHFKSLPIYFFASADSFFLALSAMASFDFLPKSCNLVTTAASGEE